MRGKFKFIPVALVATFFGGIIGVFPVAAESEQNVFVQKEMKTYEGIYLEVKGKPTDNYRKVGVALDESIEIGDNDTLSALVAKSVNANLLIILSDIDGLYTADPHKNADAKLIPVVESITPEIENLAGGEGSLLATGGMRTKISAGKICTAAHCDMVITNGSRPLDLYYILEGKSVGTRFLAVKK